MSGYMIDSLRFAKAYASKTFIMIDSAKVEC